MFTINSKLAPALLEHWCKDGLCSCTEHNGNCPKTEVLKFQPYRTGNPEYPEETVTDLVAACGEVSNTFFQKRVQELAIHAKSTGEDFNTVDLDARYSALFQMMLQSAAELLEKNTEEQDEVVNTLSSLVYCNLAVLDYSVTNNKRAKTE